MIPLLPSLLALALYLVPVALVVAIGRGAGRAPTLLAVDIPCAVALDMLGMLLLARFMRLDAAVLLSRAVWAAAGLTFGVARAWRRGRSRASRPAAGALAALAGAAAVGLALSVCCSRPYAIWDRQWHIPLVTSLRGQMIPFVNVYQPGLRLGYHLSGDVLAAALQALSWGRLHSSAALSLAHDLLFTLTALVVSALLLRPGRGPRWSLLVLIAPAVVLLAGPLTVGRFDGYSYLNYYEMSFRPHVVLAGLLIAGITSAVLLALLPPPTQPRPRVLAPVLVMLALLAITDEPSAAMLLPALGLVVFLGRREIPERLPWPLVVALFPATVALAVLAFPSTLMGGPRPPVTLSAPHVPSLYAPSLPLASFWGPPTLVADVSPLLAVLALVAVFAARTRRRELAAALAFAATIVAVACLLLTTVVVGGSQGESHRFMTLPTVVLPLLGLHTADLAWRRLVRWAVAVVLGAPAVCTLVWAIVSIPLFREFLPGSYAEGIPAVDCRASTGARLFEAVRPSYVPESTWYLWTGCHPVLAAGHSKGAGETVDVGRPITGKAALLALSRAFVSARDDLTVACPGGASLKDPICRFAIARRACAPAGAAWLACTLSPADRAALLAGAR